MDLLTSLPSLALAFAALALLCGVVWIGRRSQGMLLWMSAAWGYAALGAAVFAWLAASSSLAHIASVMLACTACAHAAQAMAWRFGRRIHQGAVVVGSVLALMGAVAAVYASTAFAWWAYVMTLGLAMVAGHVLRQLWRMPSRHGAERSLLLSYSVWCILVAASPWLAAASGHGTNAVMLLCLAAAAVTAAMLACVYADGSRNAIHPKEAEVVNRATLEKSFNRQSAEQQISFLVLCDLDQFRSHHALWGEGVSKALLAQFAQLLQASVRAGDHVVRVAHDEFALALRHIDRSNAQALVQRILESMRQQTWVQIGHTAPITASFGICMVRDTDTLEVALHRADVLLCQAKDAGGNRLAIEEGHAGGAPSEG